ncbi:tRNA pseudouridine(54/55) synthase Pus10 [Methanococcus maripaludis]|uniref:tRNA pseudouridine synthase Pus10 n=2 Tax=Methanococcus maripaludis TaxID=39152 RepID=A0A7J9PH77_METMI|nr:tRNA pseudouridine(54/55) synthase Pus10 [Methanococcus maripaludis]MBA2862573.1 tRNA pseudouridine synthase 10 [Methanococcus maripaludis]
MNIDYSVLKKYPLCDRCFGRLYGKLIRSSNFERGHALKLAKAIELEEDLRNALEKMNESSENSDNQINPEKLEEIKELMYSLYKSGISGIKLDLIEDIEKYETKFKNEAEYEKTEECEELCPWCKGIFEIENIEKVAENVVDALSEYEFDSFLIGTKLPKRFKELENEIETPFMESIRQEFGRELGKVVVPLVKRRVDKENPDIVVMVNPYNQKVTLQVNPVFIKGRYKKLVRGIPQSHWHCRSCKGKGCEKCNFTGKQYMTSVEEIIAEPFMDVMKGSSEALHGAGREDIDVRMLGNGRPFVIEIKEPKVRKVNLEELASKVNASETVEILNVEYGLKKDVHFFKNEPHKKTYLAQVECDEKVSSEEVAELVNKLEDLVIDQRTPDRVSHRRADLVRVRKVYKAWPHMIDDYNFELKIFCDGGLYIKELISSDEGRTTPSVSELLNNKCICKFLDVLDVHDYDDVENI